MEIPESTTELTVTETSTLNESFVLIEEQRETLPRFIASSDDPLLTDVWIGMILILMVLVCVGYICACILYHKFRRWKRHGIHLLVTLLLNFESNLKKFWIFVVVIQAQHSAVNIRPSFCDDYTYEESLPSYTIVTGLPSYDQAMEQFLQLRAIRRVSSPKLAGVNDDQNGPRITFARLSLGEIFQFYKVDKNLPV